MKRKQTDTDLIHACMYDMLCLLGCGVNGTIPPKALLEKYRTENRTCGEEPEAAQERQLYLYRVSQAHFVDALTGTVLKQAGVSLFPDWAQSIAKAVRKEILFDAERTKLFSFMEQNGIWYLPLKGIILKEYYPAVGMRQMSDQDILFDETYAQDVRQYMVSRGYKVESYGENHHDVYEKNPVYNFELHRSLYTSSHKQVWAAYYKNIKEKLLLQDRVSYGQQMTDEDFYVFMVSHAYKHYDGQGTGIRTLLDFYVYLQAKTELDFSYIETECRKLEIDAFEKDSRVLCKKVFGENAVNAIGGLGDEERNMLSYYLGSGVYGSRQQMVKNRLTAYKKEGRHFARLYYSWHRLFPGMEVYQHYPFSGHKITLPLCWLYRIFDMLSDTGRRKGVMREVEAVRREIP